MTWLRRSPLRHNSKESSHSRQRDDAAVETTADLPTITGLQDARASEELATEGFIRIPGLLSPSAVARAQGVFGEAMERLDEPIGEQWFPTILLHDERTRRFITDSLESLVMPPLALVLSPELIEMVRLDFSVKPSSAMSELGPHQDYSMVDERRATSLYIWIPLEDSTESNGALHVVPRSHRFSNRIRSRHVPSVFDEVLDLVHESSVRLDTRAGDLVVMVSGVIHHSPPNRSNRTRVAVHGIFKPRSAPLVFYFADEATAADKVECYEMDIVDYVRHIHEGRPGPEHECIGLAARPPSSMSRARFRDGLARVTAANRDDPLP